MATTTKKAPVKKATTAKKPAAKKTTAKKAPAKTATVVKKSTTTRKASTARPAAKKTAAVRSFRIDRNPQPMFTSFSITRQTVYWIILVAFIIFVQLWILKLQVEVVSLLDAQQALLGE